MWPRGVWRLSIYHTAMSETRCAGRGGLAYRYLIKYMYEEPVLRPFPNFVSKAGQLFFRHFAPSQEMIHRVPTIITFASEAGR